MTQGRLWKHTSHAEGRVMLGASRPQAVRSRSETPEAAALESALQRANARIRELEAQLATSREEFVSATDELTDIKGQISTLQQTAEQQGHAAGLAKAGAESQRELEKQVASWERTLEQLLKQNEARWQSLRGELTDVVIASVIKLLGEQLANPQGARAALDHAIRESGISVLRLLISPSHYDQLLKQGGPQLASLRERRIEIAPDARIAHGGCLLETASGVVDGRFESQLARLRDIIAAHYGPTGPAR